MNQIITPLLTTTAGDEDLVEQAKPGHGIPSQDPESSGQSQLEPKDAAREAKSVLIGGGLIAGAATDAAIGVAVVGPVGVLAGASLGAVAGAMGGAAAGFAASTEDVIGTRIAESYHLHLHIEDTNSERLARASV